MENIGNKIAQLRKSKGLSQKELAKKLNVSDKLISKWENSQCSPSIDCINDLCKIFDVDIDTFIDIPNHKKKSSKNIKKKLIITFSSILSCIFLAGFILLTHFVILPAAFKEKYLYQIAVATDKTINRGYFSMSIYAPYSSIQTEIYSGYYNDSTDYAWKYERTTKNGDTYRRSVEIMSNEILFSDYEPAVPYNPNSNYNRKYKEHFTQKYNNIQELFSGMLDYYGSDGSGSSDLLNEIPITYIRKFGDNYYYELDKKYLEDEVNNSSINIIKKPYGTVKIKNGYLKEMNMYARIGYEDDDEYKEQEIIVSISFDIESKKPKIALPDYINDLKWPSTYAINSKNLSFEDFSKTSKPTIDMNISNEEDFDLIKFRDLILYSPNSSDLKYKQI